MALCSMDVPLALLGLLLYYVWKVSSVCIVPQVSVLSSSAEIGSLKMDLNHLLACLLLLFLGASHATTDEAPSTPLFSSPSPLPTTWSSTPQTSPESTQGPTSDAIDVTSSPKPSLMQQDEDHKEPSVSSPQTEKPRLPQEKMEAAPFKFPEVDIEESGGSQQWETAAQGVAIMLMKPKGEGASPGLSDRGRAVAHG